MLSFKKKKKQRKTTKPSTIQKKPSSNRHILSVGKRFQQVGFDKVQCLTAVILQLLGHYSACAWYSLDFEGPSCSSLLALVPTRAFAVGSEAMKHRCKG